jgi:hypothetical protein
VSDGASVLNFPVIHFFFLSLADLVCAWANDSVLESYLLRGPDQQPAILPAVAHLGRRRAASRSAAHASRQASKHERRLFSPGDRAISDRSLSPCARNDVHAE